MRASLLKSIWLLRVRASSRQVDDGGYFEETLEEAPGRECLQAPSQEDHGRGESLQFGQSCE